MKKNLRLLLLVLLIGLMIFSVVGCGKSTTPTPPPVAEEPVAEEPEALDPQQVLLDAAKAYFPKVADSNNIIPSEDVKDMLESNPDSVLIIDIRSAEDFEAGHIPGAVHSPWANVGEIMDRIPRNKPVVVACYSGQTAGQTIGALRAAGFDNVKSLFYGIKLGWTGKSGFELEGTGMVAAADLPVVSAPTSEEEEILWQAAKDYFPKVATSAEGNKIIPGADLYAALQDNPSSFHVIDIRSAEHFAEGHIEHSVHSPWSKFGDLLEGLPTNRPIVVACYSGQTAGQTVGILRMMGYDAYSLFYGVRDGYVAKDNLPLVTN
ncbi:MAG: rhodanese-like domain-containing protein [Clostridiales bacterium]|jgi:rhodanese-related sulfurtransferase|nr:rhodanese-like domain-containing protein [Clostridiales bacterium]